MSRVLKLLKTKMKGMEKKDKTGSGSVLAYSPSSFLRPKRCRKRGSGIAGEGGTPGKGRGP
eukprot:758232-Hanusia_phi.AAC.5